MPDQIRLRSDTAANWTSANPVLAVGEVGVETDTHSSKIGDGVTAWSSLSYAYLTQNTNITQAGVSQGDTGRLWISPSTQTENAIQIQAPSLPLPTPTAPTVTPTGTAGATSYSYTITAVNAEGETTAGPAGSTTTGNAALTGTNYNAISWAAVTYAPNYNIYRTVGGGTTGKIGTTTGTTFSDTGLAASGASPVTNTAMAWGDNPIGSGANYGQGQTFILYKPGTGTPITQIRFRIDATGGVGVRGGAHFATGLNQGPNWTATQGVWIDNSSAPVGCVALAINAGPATTADSIFVGNNAGTKLLRVTAQNSGNDIGVGLYNSSSQNPIWLDPAPTTAFGYRLILSTLTAATGGLDIALATGQTAVAFRVANGATQLLAVLASGQLQTAAANETTGAGSAALGANCPAVTATAPYKWEKITTSDGSACFFPVWK